MGFFDKINRKNAPAKKRDDIVDAEIVDEKKSTTTSDVDVPSLYKAESRGAAYRILLRPLLSEKTTRAESKGVYTFSVALDATKPQIMNAVERVYGVRPTQVHTILVEGKAVRFGQQKGRRRNWKKALVTLPKDTTITIHTGV